jgi:hypothetical protein
MLERFEKSVDLPMYLGHKGYRLAGEQRDAGRIAMVNDRTGDAVVVSKDADGDRWTFANARNPADKGTLGTFLATREGLNPSECLTRLIALSNPLVRDPEGHRYRAFQSQPEAVGVRAATERHLAAVEGHQAVLKSLGKLGVNPATLDRTRFGEIKAQDDVAKLVADPKDLWASKYRPTDKRIVITEQPIDALAYEKNRGRGECCYMATGGAPTEAQKKRLAHVLCDMPPGTKVVLAFGRDEQGRRLAAEIQALVPTVRMEREMPEFGSRWSNQMAVEQRHARSMERLGPSMGR